MTDESTAADREQTTLAMLRAVHHPTRRRMIALLGLRGPCQVGTLARELGQQVGSISHHLRMLERVGVVEQVPELATDGRTSWWRVLETSIRWSIEDFDDPASRLQARTAEKLNITHQLDRLSTWLRHRDTATPAWRRAAFSSDTSTLASPEELADLGRRLEETVRSWTAEVRTARTDAAGADADDGRAPVFVFCHGVPVEP